MKRLYSNLIKHHLAENRQMVFMAGPRQAGKTTIGKETKHDYPEFHYFNWDEEKHRQAIISGSETIAELASLDTATETTPLIMFDEIHKYKHWKQFLKGFFDLYEQQTKIIVTGSAKLNIFKRGGDSLMGRYFCNRIHPFTVRECLTADLSQHEIQAPLKLPTQEWHNLYKFGGFPEPLIKQQETFSRRWSNLRKEQLLREDIRNTRNIQDIEQLEMLAKLLTYQISQTVNYSSLANKIKVSADTIRRWFSTLKHFYYCFSITPWSKNVPRSLLKEPKVYLWNWADVPEQDEGARIENFTACHLLKAVHHWTDRGLGEYGLYFLRDKDKREVDFIVTKNDKPWFIVEVKKSKQSLGKNLYYFQEKTKAKHVFQAIYDLPYADVDCFSYNRPINVPLISLLSQLV